jgi:hypothetical protein
MTESLSNRTHIPLTRVELTKMKAKAIRRGFWFKVLSRTERASIDLTIKVVERVHSLLLARVLGAIVRKLLDVMESRVTRVMREVGRGLAENLSRIAQNWGNKSAHHWKEDSSFVKYLAVTYINTPAMFKA